MSWFSNNKDSSNTTAGKGPSASECKLYKDNIDFIISNLKFSLVHHEARTDGTMMKAWSQEKEMLEEQIKIIQRQPKREEEDERGPRMIEGGSLFKIVIRC